MAVRSSARKSARIVSLTVDVVLFTPQGGELAVLLVPVAAERAHSRERWALPADTMRANEDLPATAARIARGMLGSAPSFLEQAGANTGPSSVERLGLTVCYFGLAPESHMASPKPDAVWSALSEVEGVSGTHKAEIKAALTAMRARVDRQPIAFRLLPPTFTLSELQSVYELLLGHRLHKASFRRSLHASSIVEATDEWRSEGRGRPAQLFRYVPPRRLRQRRGVRFDLLA